MIYYNAKNYLFTIQNNKTIWKEELKIIIYI